MASQKKKTYAHSDTQFTISFPSQSQTTLYNHQPTRLPFPVLLLPVSGCPTAIGVFSHSAEIKMYVLFVKNILLLRTGNHRHIWRRQRNVAGYVVRVRPPPPNFDFPGKKAERTGAIAKSSVSVTAGGVRHVM